MPEERILLVEGRSDERVVRHVSRHHGVDRNFGIKAKEGYAKLLQSIELEVKASGVRALGIVADANDDIHARWQEIVGQLERAGVNAPKQPKHGGVVIEGLPRIGIWLMPDNQNVGELEDFVRTLIPGHDPLWPRARKYVADIPEAHRKFKPAKRLKAQIHAWLAVQKQPGLIGAAIGEGQLDPDAPAATAFVKWLRDLFGG